MGRTAAVVVRGRVRMGGCGGQVLRRLWALTVVTSR